jgi:transcriptional regulator with XRE-family HTH domain
MKSHVLKSLGARVRELRKRKNWSQEELAERCGRHWTYIGGLERGERNATVQVLSDIADALGVPIRDLFDGGGK